MATQTIDLTDTNQVYFNGNECDHVYLNYIKIWSKNSVLKINETKQTAGNYFTLTINSSKTWDGTLYYRTRTITPGQPNSTYVWSDWAQVTTGLSIQFGIVTAGNSFIDTMEVYGVGNTGVCTNSSISSKKLWSLSGITGTPEISMEGNLLALLDTSLVISTVRQRAFQALFQDWTILKTLPTIEASINLSNYSLYRTFYGCTGISRVTSVRVNSYGANCCSQMFYNCSGISSPAYFYALGQGVLFGNNCFEKTFYGCTNITSLNYLPVYPFVNLSGECGSNVFRYMFQACTGLTTVSSNIFLSVNSLSEGCFSGLFSGCSSLITPPNLPSNVSLTNSCYNSMFYGCTSLTSAPSLPATTLAEGCYRAMFQNCTSLTNAPSLPATTLATSCYYNMFYGCTSLTSAPSLPATTLAEDCYRAMFQDCTSITNAPSLPATTLAPTCYFYMFKGCTSLTSIPYLPATVLARSCYGYMFYGCSNICISDTQDTTYINALYIPPEPSANSGSVSFMFTDTGGSFTGTPLFDTTYYTSNTIISS